MKEKMYYIRDSRVIVGNTPLWWKHNDNGYVSDIKQAKKVNYKTALKMLEGRPTDIPWEVDFIDSIAKSRVDIQDMQALDNRCFELRLDNKPTND